jgi:hypothetical protein
VSADHQRRCSARSVGGQFLRQLGACVAGFVARNINHFVTRNAETIHCSVTALNRHLSREHIESGLQLTVSVEPSTTDAELLNTVLHACAALMGAVVCVNEMLGSTSATEKLKMLLTEFEEYGWVLKLREMGAG